jgi:hypothetical protein
VDRAISSLNAGRGLTQSKVQTFEKRVIAEESKPAFPKWNGDFVPLTARNVLYFNA